MILWGQNVGELYWDAHDRCAYFNYFPEFVARGLDIAPLTASITKPALRHGEVYKGSKDGRWSVSPAYDICFTYDLTGMGFGNHHELSLNGKTRNFDRNDLIVFGQQNDISQPEKIIDQVCSVLSDFRKYAKENGISETVSDIIQKHLDHNMGIDREQLKTTTVSQLPGDVVLTRISITSNKKGRALTIEVNNQHRMSKLISSEDYIAQRVGLISKEELAVKYFKEEMDTISKEQ